MLWQLKNQKIKFFDLFECWIVSIYFLIFKIWSFKFWIFLFFAFLFFLLFCWTEVKPNPSLSWARASYAPACFITFLKVLQDCFKANSTLILLHDYLKTILKLTKLKSKKTLKETPSYKTHPRTEYNLLLIIILQIVYKLVIDSNITGNISTSYW